MWVRVATAYNWEFMPFLIWTILAMVGCIFLCIINYLRTDLIQQLVRSRKSAALCMAALWLMHFIIIWYIFSELFLFRWMSSMHWTEAEARSFWHSVTQSCIEWGLLSSLSVIY